MSDFTQTLLSINYLMDLIAGALVAGGVGLFYYRPNIPEVIKTAMVETANTTIKRAVSDVEKITKPKDAGQFFEGLGGYVNNIMGMTNGAFAVDVIGNTGKGLW